jgi:hypothetical protein
MTETFGQHRPWLFALAYRMLGTAMDAEDVLQEAHLRFSEHGAQVQYPKRWLEQVVTRLCPDQLKSARARRERYVGPWLPEPLETEGATLQGTPVDPESSLGAALVLALLHAVRAGRLVPPAIRPRDQLAAGRTGASLLAAPTAQTGSDLRDWRGRVVGGCHLLR